MNASVDVTKTALLAAALLLTGCATVQPPALPVPDVPAAYREADQAANQAPGQAAPARRPSWWQIFQDSTLDELIKQGMATNPTLSGALARIALAKADVRTSDASRGLQMSLELSAVRQREPLLGHGATSQAQANLWYEVDLFGALKHENNAVIHDWAAQEAAYQAALLLLQEHIAHYYFAVRQADAELHIVRHSLGLLKRALELQEQRHANGDSSQFDLARARLELANTGVDLVELERQRELLDHALAVLLGQPPARFSLASATLRQVPVTIPPGLPAELLERRFDVVQAKRRLSAASERVGVAQADYFPRLVLTASSGFASAQLRDLLHSPQRTWLLGSLLTSLVNVPLTGNSHQEAQLQRKQAAYDEALAEYRQQVLAAFRDVEDGLTTLRALASESDLRAQALRAAQHSAELADTLYKYGSVRYDDVIEAQRTRLAAERAAARHRGAQLQAAAKLAQALGGGW